MSKVVKGFPGGTKHARPKGRPGWLDGRVHILESGVDFRKITCAHTARGWATAVACLYGCKLITTVHEGVVYVQATTKGLPKRRRYRQKSRRK